MHTVFSPSLNGLSLAALLPFLQDIFIQCIKHFQYEINLSNSVDYQFNWTAILMRQCYLSLSAHTPTKPGPLQQTTHGNRNTDYTVGCDCDQWLHYRL